MSVAHTTNGHGIGCQAYVIIYIANNYSDSIQALGEPIKISLPYLSEGRLHPCQIRCIVLFKKKYEGENRSHTAAKIFLQAYTLSLHRKDLFFLVKVFRYPQENQQIEIGCRVAT